MKRLMTLAVIMMLMTVANAHVKAKSFNNYKVQTID